MAAATSDINNYAQTCEERFTPYYCLLHLIPTGNLEAVQYFQAQIWPNIRYQKLPELVLTAAKAGQEEILNFLLQPLTPKLLNFAITGAAIGGHLELFDRLRAQGGILNSGVELELGKKGNISLIQEIARREGRIFWKDILVGGAIGDHVNVIQLALENGVGDYAWYAWIKAIEHTSPTVINFLHPFFPRKPNGEYGVVIDRARAEEERWGIPRYASSTSPQNKYGISADGWSVELTIKAAAEAHNIPLLIDFRSHGGDPSKTENDVLDGAVQGGHVDIFQRYQPANIDSRIEKWIQIAAKYGRLGMCEYLVSLLPEKDNLFSPGPRRSLALNYGLVGACGWQTEDKHAKRQLVRFFIHQIPQIFNWINPLKALADSEDTDPELFIAMHEERQPID